MLNKQDLEGLLSTVERMRKSGNIHLSIRTVDDANVALERELLIDYSLDPLRPVLKVKDNGEVKFVYTKSDLLLNEFLANILKVGLDETENEYSPNIYYKLFADSSGNTGYNQEVIAKFYNELQNNDDYKPFLNYVNDENTGHKLYPFMDTDHIYLDLTQVINHGIESAPGDRNIKTVTDLIQYLYDMMLIIEENITHQLTMQNDLIVASTNTMLELEAEQNDMINDLIESNANNLETINKAYMHLEELEATAERRVRKLEFTLNTGKNKVIPVLFKIVGGQDHTVITEEFNSSLFIASNQYEVISKIDCDIAWNTTPIPERNAFNFTIIKNHATSTCIYDIIQVASDSYIAYLKDNHTYNIFNKYIETLEITPNPAEYPEYTDKELTDIINYEINGGEWANVTYRKIISTGLHIVRGIQLGGVMIKGYL